MTQIKKKSMVMDVPKFTSFADLKQENSEKMQPNSQSQSPIQPIVSSHMIQKKRN